MAKSTAWQNKKLFGTKIEINTCTWSFEEKQEEEEEEEDEEEEEEEEKDEARIREEEEEEKEMEKSGFSIISIHICHIDSVAILPTLRVL